MLPLELKHPVRFITCEKLSCHVAYTSIVQQDQYNLFPHACEMCLQAFKITFLKNLKPCFHTLSEVFF